MESLKHLLVCFVGRDQRPRRLRAQGHTVSVEAGKGLGTMSLKRPALSVLSYTVLPHPEK